MIKVGIITASDRGALGETEDLSGKVIMETIETIRGSITDYRVVSDELEDLKKAMIDMCQKGVDLILTTGGRAFPKRQHLGNNCRRRKRGAGDT